MIAGISLILLSIIAVPSWIISRKPNANELLSKIEPVQAWVGFAFCFWGIWGVITAVLNVGWIDISPVWWVTFLTGNLVCAILGFILGSGLINQLFISNNETAAVAVNELRRDIARTQGRLGILGLVIGLWMIIASFLYTIA